MRNGYWVLSERKLSIFAAVLFALFLRVDTLHACCMATPILIEDTTIVSSSEQNMIVRFSYTWNFVDPDPHLKEKTVSTTGMMSDIVNRYTNSNIVTIGIVNDVESFYSDFDSEGYSYHCEKVEVTIERVLKGDIVAGDYEFTYQRWGDERIIVYDSITGEPDTISMFISLTDPGYTGLVGKRFMHFSRVENPDTADYVASKPEACEGIHGFFLNDDDEIIFENIAFRDTNDFTFYPLLSVPVEQYIDRVNTLAVNPGGRLNKNQSNPASCPGKMELFTVTGRRVTVRHDRSIVDGVAAGLYIRKIEGGTQRKNLLLISDGKR